MMNDVKRSCWHRHCQLLPNFPDSIAGWGLNSKIPVVVPGTQRMRQGTPSNLKHNHRHPDVCTTARTSLRVTHPTRTATSTAAPYKLRTNESHRCIRTSQLRCHQVYPEPMLSRCHICLDWHGFPGIKVHSRLLVETTCYVTELLSESQKQPATVAECRVCNLALCERPALSLIPKSCTRQKFLSGGNLASPKMTCLKQLA